MGLEELNMGFPNRFDTLIPTEKRDAVGENEGFNASPKTSLELGPSASLTLHQFLPAWDVQVGRI